MQALCQSVDALSLNDLQTGVPALCTHVPFLLNNRVLNIQLKKTDDIDEKLHLSMFDACAMLQELTIRGLGERDDHHVVGFDIPTQIPVRSLTLSNVTLMGEFFKNLPTTLQHLALENCRFKGLYRHGTLASLKELDHFTLKTERMQAVALKQDIFILRLRNPKIAFDLPDYFNDHTDYSQVVTKDKGVSLLEYALSPDELKKALKAAKAEDESWKTKDNKSHRPFPKPDTAANYIKCPDGRVRLAAHEPTMSDLPKFWAYVHACVNVIVMVKELGTAYFPAVHGEVRKMSDAITVHCIKVIVNKEEGYSYRELLVNGKTVHHLQLDWEDNKGICEKRLSNFIDRVQVYEKDLNGETLVHCRAGHGRTGTFYGAFITKQLLDKWKQEPRNDEPVPRLDVSRLAVGLRQQRRKQIATTAQYQTIFKTAKLFYSRAKES